MKSKMDFLDLNLEAIDYLNSIGCDPVKYKFGNLCSKNHVFLDLQMSIRNIKNHRCLSCVKEEYKKYKVDNSENLKETRKKAKAKAANLRATNRQLSVEAEEFLISINYDPSKYCFGKICKRNHEFNDTGYTIRLLNNGNDCVFCKKEYLSNYYETNKTHILNSCKERYRENAKEIQLSRKAYKERTKEHKAKTDREYRLRNLDRIKIRIQLWCEENPEKLKVLRRKRKALVRNATIETITKQDYQDTRLKFFNRCVYCDTRLKNATEHWDHVLPISKGGKHCKTNLVPTCDRCNLAKSSKLLNDWYPSQPFYSALRHRKILIHIQDKETLETLLNLVEQL